MGSLFDLAADLSQYVVESPPEDVEGDSRQHEALHEAKSHRTTKDMILPTRSHAPDTSSNQETGDMGSQMSALSLLDEALMTIYEARQPQQSQSKPDGRLIYQRSAPILPIFADAGEKMKAQSTPSRSPSFTTPNPLQSVFSQSLAVKSTAASVTGHVRDRIPPPPPAPPTQPSLSARSGPKANNSKPTQDADVAAKSALRELQEEIEQIPHGATATAAQVQRHQRMLLDKYLGNGLVRPPTTPDLFYEQQDKALTCKICISSQNLLPSTAFVLLAKRKIQQKIDQLSVRPIEKVSTPENNKSPLPATATTTLPAAQHVMLTKLAQIPDSHVAKLSSTQQKMVQFAKRYDKILKLSNDELQRLPVSQAQLLQQLRDQLPRDTYSYALT